jgi:hypothetical protein
MPRLRSSPGVGHSLQRVALTLLAWCLTIGATRPAAAQPDPFLAMNAMRPLSPGPVPDVTFRRLDGQVARLESFRGRPILLTFFTTW